MSGVERAQTETEKTKKDPPPFPEKGTQPPLRPFRDSLGITNKTFRRKEIGDMYARLSLTRFEKIASLLDHPEKEVENSEGIDYENLARKIFGICLHEAATLADIWNTAITKENGLSYEQRLHRAAHRVAPTSTHHEILRFINLLSNNRDENGNETITGNIFDIQRRHAMNGREGSVYREIGKRVLRSMKSSYPFTNTIKAEDIIRKRLLKELIPNVSMEKIQKTIKEKTSAWKISIPNPEELNAEWNEKALDEKVVDKVFCMFAYHQENWISRRVLASPQSSFFSEPRFYSLFHRLKAVFSVRIDELMIREYLEYDSKKVKIVAIDYKTSFPRIPDVNDQSYWGRFHKVDYWLLAHMLKSLGTKNIISLKGTSREVVNLEKSFLEPIDPMEVEIIQKYVGFGESNQNPFKEVNVTERYVDLWIDPLKNAIMLNEFEFLLRETKNNDRVKHLVGL